MQHDVLGPSQAKLLGIRVELNPCSTARSLVLSTNQTKLLEIRVGRSETASKSWGQKKLLGFRVISLRTGPQVLGTRVLGFRVDSFQYCTLFSGYEQEYCLEIESTPSKLDPSFGENPNHCQTCWNQSQCLQNCAPCFGGQKKTTCSYVEFGGYCDPFETANKFWGDTLAGNIVGKPRKTMSMFGSRN